MTPYNRDLVLDALERNGPAGLTRKEAACTLDVYNLSDDIRQLEARGAVIHRHDITQSDAWGRTHKRIVYVLGFVPHDLRRSMIRRMGRDA